MLKDLREENNYYEIQQFRQIWVWLILLLVEFALLFTILSGMINLLVSIIIISIGFGFIWLLYRMKLITIINEDGINIIFAPFTNFIIPFNKIKKYQIRQYRPIIEYGGWGIRYSKSGKAYNVSGKIGLQIELTNGKRLLIGTQNPDALLQTLNEIINKN
tara:strand:+ start:1814 stop:2293 length:480 start_codon:yes stop_codon:yes gene_type:complete